MIKDILQMTTINDFKGINARNLHQALKVRRDFSNWIKSRLNGADFIEEQDFITVQNSSIGSPKLASQKSDYFLPDKIGEQKEARGGHNRYDYILSIDTAKHICLMEKNEVGREIRNYFIEAEKQLQKIAPNVYRNNLEATQKRLASIDYNHALKQSLQSHLIRQGKQPQPKHFINESKLIDGLTVGVSIKEWKERNNIKGNPRDYFTLEQLEIVKELEKTDSTLLELDIRYQERKKQLIALAARLHRFNEV
ncbi:TPA: antA/AntB antirepressor family protein [Mannheimia haemolytica]